MSDVAYIGPGGRRRPLLRKLVGAVLRRTRQEQRRTLADVARDARVSMPYLSEIERGRKEASSEVLGAVCNALRIELADLLAAVRHDLVKARPDLVIDRDSAGQGQQERQAAPSPATAEPTASVVSLDAARMRRAEVVKRTRFSEAEPTRFSETAPNRFTETEPAHSDGSGRARFSEVRLLAA